jgi:hypothetical protein
LDQHLIQRLVEQEHFVAASGKLLDEDTVRKILNGLARIGHVKNLEVTQSK